MWSARLRRSRGCWLIGFNTPESAPQRLKTALAETEQFGHEPNNQRQKTQYQDQHQDWMVKNQPKTAQNGDVLANTSCPVAEGLRARVDGQPHGRFGAVRGERDGASG